MLDMQRISRTSRDKVFKKFFTVNGTVQSLSLKGGRLNIIQSVFSLQMTSSVGSTNSVTPGKDNRK